MNVKLKNGLIFENINTITFHNDGECSIIGIITTIVKTNGISIISDNKIYGGKNK